MVLKESANVALGRLLKPKTPLAVLAGAGVSVAAPTGLPTAKRFMKETIHVLVDSQDSGQVLLNHLACNRLDGTGLRFESFIEVLQDTCDPNLDILDLFIQPELPNQNHFALANLIELGHLVLTTNFDTFIEQACLTLNLTCTTITDEQGFEKLLRSSVVYPLLKLHGTVTSRGIDGKLSIKATLRAIAREGYRIERNPTKRAVLSKILEKQDLLVIGYSGGDDYDIVPVLKTIASERLLIWVAHEPGKDLAVHGNDITALRISHPVTDILEEKNSERDPNKVWLLACDTCEVIRKLSEIYSIDLEHSQHGPDNSQEPKFCWSIFFDKWARAHLSDGEMRRLVVAEMLWRSGEREEAHQMFKSLVDSSDVTIRSFSRVRVNALHMDMGEYGYMRKMQADDHTQMGIFSIDLASIVETVQKGDILARIGRDESAESCYTEALNNVEEPVLKAGVKGKLANLYIRKKNWKKAAATLSECAGIYRECGLAEQEANAIWAWGNVMFHTGRYDEALRQYEESYRMIKWLGDDGSVAKLLSQIGVAHQKLGNVHLAVESYEESIRLKERLNDFYGLGFTFLNLAILKQENDELSEAEKLCRKSLQMAEKVRDQAGIAFAYAQLGWVLYLKGEFDKAQSHSEQARETASRLDDKSILERIEMQITQILKR